MQGARIGEEGARDQRHAWAAVEGEEVEGSEEVAGMVQRDAVGVAQGVGGAVVAVAVVVAAGEEEEQRRCMARTGVCMLSALTYKLMLFHR